MAEKHTLFLVHGVGVHTPDVWSDDVTAKLKEVSKAYAFFQNQPLEDLVDFVPVSYDRFLIAALNRWKQSGQSLAAFARTSQLVDADSMSWLEDVRPEDGSVVWTHVADVVLYRFFKLEQNRIQDSVKLQFGERVAAVLDRDASAGFSVVAHSLGTAVAHDALAELASPRLDGKLNTLAPPNFRFNSIHMLANTSRLLQTRIKAYESLVRPGPRNSKSSYCLRYYNYRHELDPVPGVRAFEPSGWGDLFTGEVVRHYRDWDIHGFTHYLDNPRVHVPILNSITRTDAIPRPERAQAIGAYPQFGGRLQVLPDLQAKISKLGALKHQIGEDSSLAEAFETIREMLDVLGEIRAELDAVAGGIP